MSCQLSPCFKIYWGSDSVSRAAHLNGTGRAQCGVTGMVPAMGCLLNDYRLSRGMFFIPEKDYRNEIQTLQPWNNMKKVIGNKCLLFLIIKWRYLKWNCQVALSGPKSILLFIQEISKLNYSVKCILVGMLKAELISKNQNHNEKIVWELLKMSVLAQEASWSYITKICPGALY